MQGPFAGIGGVLSRTFGGPVTVYPSGGAGRVIAGIFRLTPTVADAQHGVEVQGVAITLRAPARDLADINQGDLIDPGEGQIYAVAWREPPAGPAPDALVTLRLEVADE